MPISEKADPPIVSEQEWLAARVELLKLEKELTHQRDAVNAARRRLPMVEVTKDYVFEGPEGEARLLDLFEGRSQLLIDHFMWREDLDAGCPSCSFLVDNIGDLRHLHARDTSLVLVSRVPFAHGEEYFRRRMGWSVPWYSSYGSDFNYDYHATIDPARGAVEYNYRTGPELGEGWENWSGEMPGVSAFLRHGGRVFHTYSSYGRGSDLLLGTYNWLDLTARGRQEDWEEPPGRSDGPYMSWLRHHDRYDD